MRLSSSLLLALAPGLISAWQLTLRQSDSRSGEERVEYGQNNNNFNCKTLGRDRDGLRYYRWETQNGGDGRRDQYGNKCCVHLYDNRSCRRDGDNNNNNNNYVKHCRDYSDYTQFNINSFEVICDRDDGPQRPPGYGYGPPRGGPPPPPPPPPYYGGSPYGGPPQPPYGYPRGPCPNGRC